jgi:pyruvate/2-oxoglutarate dehydrogenase complex dihydrolipoamide acyltransferase (E2) component
MTNVVVPDGLWDADTDGVVSSWLYSNGERVTQGQPLCELMYEKAAYELEAPASGVLTILIPVEQPVRAGHVIATIAS